jgi:8-oxo-dGTP diphosphatase
MNNRGLRRVDVAYVFITNEAGEVLTVLNDNGSWTLPGGAREAGETLQETALREAKEETGLDISVEAVLDVSERLRHEHALFITFRASITGGILGEGLSPDVQRVEWKSSGEIQRLIPWCDVEAVLKSSATYHSHSSDSDDT